MNGRRCIALLLMAVFMAACTSSIKVPEPAEGPTHALLTVDSLLWQQPDSALACLVSCFDACTTTEYNRHYANLLLSELLYKNDYAQTNRPELQQAVAYFDSLVRKTPPLQRRSEGFPPLKGGKGDSKRKPISNNDHFFLAARAHYINGVGYYENDSAVPACREYLKALEIMEGRFEEKELVGKKAKFMALTYTHVEGLFSDYYLHDQAICFGKKSLKYFKNYTASPRHVAWMLNEFGSQYEMKEMFDSACFYYQSGINVLHDTNNLTYRDLATHLAFCSYKKDKTPSSSLTQLYNLLAQVESERERLSRCLTLGEFYYHEKQLDSARLYLSIVYEGTKSIGSKKQAAEWLVEICEAEGRLSEAHEYARFLVPFATANETQSALKSQLTELCYNYEENRQEALHRLKTQKAAMRWGIALVLAAFVVSVVSLLLVILRRRMRTEQYSHKMEQAALSGRLKRSNEALRDVTQQFEQAVAKTAVAEETETFDDYVAFMNVPVCQHIIRLVHKQQFKSKVDYMNYKDDALSKEQLLALRDAAEKHLVRFTSHIRKQFPNLTEGDMDYCYLFLLGLKEADISALIQRAYSTVCERSRKINRIIEAKGDLYHTLRNMLFE